MKPFAGVVDVDGPGVFWHNLCMASFQANRLLGYSPGPGAIHCMLSGIYPSLIHTLPSLHLAP
jgi:hypothetical protein